MPMESTLLWLPGDVTPLFVSFRPDTSMWVPLENFNAPGCPFSRLTTGPDSNVSQPFPTYQRWR